MSNDWIKLYRSIQDSAEWEILTPEGRSVLISILLNCNWKPSEAFIDGEKRIIECGQWLTSVDTIRRLSGKGITIRNVRTAISNLEKTGFLTNEVTNGNKRIMSVNNWKKYQTTDGVTNELPNGWQTSGKRVADEWQNHKKEERRKKKEDIKKPPPPDKAELSELFQEFENDYKEQYKTILGKEAPNLKDNERRWIDQNITETGFDIQRLALITKKALSRQIEWMTSNPVEYTRAKFVRRLDALSDVGEFEDWSDEE